MKLFEWLSPGKVWVSLCCWQNHFLWLLCAWHYFVQVSQSYIKILDYCICSHILNRDIAEGICSPTWGKSLSKPYKMGSVFPFCLSPVPYCMWVAQGQHATAEVFPCVRFFYHRGFYVNPALAYAHFPSHLLPRWEEIFGNTKGLNKVTYIL